MLAAGRVRSKKKTTEKKNTNPAAPKTHHEIHSSPATATTSRRRATKHVPRVSPYSPASIDAGFVEISLVQLSQLAKTTNNTHTGRQINSIMAPCMHPGTSREVNEASRPHTCSKPWAFEIQTNKKRKKTISRRTQNTPQNPQQPGDRGHLETACDETSHAVAHTRPLP